jgi:hypothetical protein
MRTARQAEVRGVVKVPGWSFAGGHGFAKYTPFWLMQLRRDGRVAWISQIGDFCEMARARYPVGADMDGFTVGKSR